MSSGAAVRRGRCTCPALAEQVDPDNNGSQQRHGAFHGNFHVGSSNVEGWPDIRRVGNLHEHGGPECVLSRLGRQWHIDGPKTTAPHLSFLFGIECAGPGSETLFCSGLQAFAALPAHLKEVVRSGRVMKSWRYRSGGPVARDWVNGLRMSDNGLRVSQRCHTFQPTWRLSVDYEPLASILPAPYDQTCPSFVFSPVALDRICDWDDRVVGPVGDGLTADEEWCEPRCDCWGHIQQPLFIILTSVTGRGIRTISKSCCAMVPKICQKCTLTRVSTCIRIAHNLQTNLRCHCLC